MAEEESGEGGGGGGAGKAIVLLLLLLLAAAAGAWYYLTQQEAAPEEEEVEFEQGPPPLENPLYMSLGSYVVNLKGGKYFLKATIDVVFADPASMAWLQARMPEVNDQITSLLETQSSKSVMEPKSRQLLRRDIIIRLNSLFPNSPAWEDKKPIKKVLFQEFYRQ